MVELKIGMDLQITTRKGKKYIFVSKAHSSTSEPSFKYKFNENERELTELHKILDDVINNNNKEILIQKGYKRYKKYKSTKNTNGREV